MGKVFSGKVLNGERTVRKRYCNYMIITAYDAFYSQYVLKVHPFTVLEILYLQWCHFSCSQPLRQQGSVLNSYNAAICLHCVLKMLYIIAHYCTELNFSELA